MSAYVANNPILYNTALSGIIAASGAGANPSGTGTAVTAANAEAVAAALPLAQAVDALIAGDATITTTGATNVPTTAAISNVPVESGETQRAWLERATAGFVEATYGLAPAPSPSPPPAPPASPRRRVT